MYNKTQFSKQLYISVVPTGYSSYVSPMKIISSIFITAIIPSILKHAIVDLMSFVNFHKPENIPCGSTAN